MRKIGYHFFRVWLRTAITFYFAKIKVEGLHDIPTGKPVMFLANHQNALLDALLVATHCNRKPYFLTRSDVFKTTALKMLFEFLRMIPVYRIRDGKDSLKRNTAIFERCSDLLGKGEAILIFPEGNHSLKRRVRPLSKGFTRILFLALETNPSMEIGIVPIGVNYANAAKFPDKAALYYGEEIKVQDFFDKDDISGSAGRLKQEVYHRLKKLTTHIEAEARYDDIIQKLKGSDVDYLNPKAVNLILEKEAILNPKFKGTDSAIKYLWKVFFIMLNFPMIILWSQFIKPKVTEQEFLSTTRFMFALLIYPLQCLVLMVALLMVFSWPAALVICLVHLILNIVLVKLQ
ncbi:1-acyl-sn-glycerol-3-phosphate acyltransferase [Arenibacter sp. BSSL-BM3]|uniref:1-acyl-sn-glycerol-3-phosphate acyltransferase n=1 Tax=Arenibacter arenosicollis TaxID=2762274 RepID=A0ABR7QLT0_9FLAO|nr:lysophospholipid acyltransferase family protein [Arenibacter arenosicollis]MBC8767989.1 1-acyl-sn-glycerol-3-phosphate acyltransferase [Arenibacter arenosicollis]